MASKQQLSLLKKGATAWRRWRVTQWNLKEPDRTEPDLYGADLQGMKLPGVNFNDIDLGEANLRRSNLRGADLSLASLSWADLREANLEGANLDNVLAGNANFCGARMKGARVAFSTLIKAKLRGVDLRDADLNSADLRDADLTKSDLRGASLRGANLVGANLQRAKLAGADLSLANLVGANLQKANLDNSRVYGVSTWDVRLNGAGQVGLIITPPTEPTIRVDDLEVAQFVYLILNNKSIRRVIDTMTSKAVLLLGRFTPQRKGVLDAVRSELRKLGYVPIIFDFEAPAERDITETITLLARMVRFIIADLTEPSSIPKELEAIVPMVAVPVQPVIQGSRSPYSMFKDYWKYPWVLKLLRYEEPQDLVASLKTKIIEAAEKQAKKLQKSRNEVT